MPDNEKWTPEQRDAFRAQGRTFRLALARQTPKEKAQQREQMNASLNAEQLDHALHLWESLVHAVQELSRAMQGAHEDLAQKVGQMQDQQQQKDTDDHGCPLPARGRM